MKRLLTFILLTLFSLTFVFGQTGKKSVSKQSKKDEFNIHVDTLKVHTAIDTLKIQVGQSKKEPDSENKMPWIVALIIGVLTVLINYIIAKINQNTAIKNIDKQIATSLTTTKNQIEISKELAIEQMQNSQKLAYHDFNMTLKTKNRQEWLSELRNTIAEFSSQAKQLNVEFQEPIPNKDKISVLHEKIAYGKSKIYLLINPTKDPHKNLLDAINSLLTTLDSHLSSYRRQAKDFNNAEFATNFENVLKVGRELLYHEWQKIQTYLDKDTTTI